VTGRSFTAGGDGHAFVWDDTTDPKMTDLGALLSGTDSTGRAINNTGQVTGEHNGSGDHAFLWNGTTMVDLATLEPGGGSFSYGNAINDAGLVTGSVGVSGQHHAFLSDGTALVDLGTLEGFGRSVGVAINSSGQVTGDSSATILPSGGSFHAFLAMDGAPPTMNDIGTLGGSFSEGVAINDAGQITGDAYPTGSFNKHAFLWDDTATPKMADLGTLGGMWSMSAAVNASGQVTGYSDTGFGFHAFLAEGGTTPTMNDLGTLGGTNSEGFAINAASQVTGYSDTGSDSHAFLWDGGPMQDLNDLIDPSDPLQPHVTLEEGADINDFGQILAHGFNSLTGEYGAFLVSPSPLNDLIATAGAIGKGKNKEVFVTLEWTDLFDDETGFEIERAEVVGKGKNKRCDDFERIDTAGENSESFEDDAVDRRTQYCYQVKVVSPTLPRAPSNVAQAKTR
jgi:probable HAF family extracellular repeat protein